MAQNHSIDLADPRVQQILGGTSPLSTGKARQAVQLAGDAPDPTGMTSGHGLLSTHHMNAGKQEVAVIYGDMILTVDVYALPGEPMRAQIICPRCHKHSTIPGDRKRIEYDPGALNPMQRPILLHAGRGELPEVARIAQFGRLSIETFECTWERGDDQHVPGMVHTGGASLCRLRLVIENNRAREV
jgi:hypothetical protein